MKLVALWLVDSFTVVPASSHNRKPGRQYFPHVSSPTGSLLLPLLHFLKFIPFDKNLVVTSQIHKSIRRLKKALNALVEGLDPNSLEQEVHPIAGGLSVGKVIAAVDTVMTLWSKSAAEKVILNGSSVDSSFPQLQTKIQRRFGDFSKFQKEGPRPPWLPKIGVWGRQPRLGNQIHLTQLYPKVILIERSWHGNGKALHWFKLVFIKKITNKEGSTFRGLVIQLAVEMTKC